MPHMTIFEGRDFTAVVITVDIRGRAPKLTECLNWYPPHEDTGGGFQLEARRASH